MENHYITNPAVDLGLVEYEESLSLQRYLVDNLRKWGRGDIILLLSHPPVYTVGRGKNADNYKGVEVIETERGGDVTYHGPGQIVIYPIIDLDRNKIEGVRKYVHLIEEIILDSLRDNGFSAYIGEEPGIWVQGKKVASIGMAIKNKISFHGISINTSPKVLEGFSRIRACGIDPSLVSYVEVDEEKLKKDLIRNFSTKIHEFTFVTKDLFYSII